MNNDERIENLEQALELIEEARELVKSSMLDTDKAHFEAYGEYGFMQLVGSGNPYDYGINNLIENIEKQEEII